MRAARRPYLYVSSENSAAIFRQSKRCISKTKKEILGLIFKKIFIGGGASSYAKASADRQNEKISPSLYDPFQKIADDAEKFKNFAKGGENCAPISSKLTDEQWSRIYHKLKLVLEFVFKEDLANY